MTRTYSIRRELLQAVALFRHREQHAPAALRAVHLEPREGGGTYLVATDGAALAIALDEQLVLPYPIAFDWWIDKAVLVGSTVTLVERPADPDRVTLSDANGPWRAERIREPFVPWHAYLHKLSAVLGAPVTAATLAGAPMLAAGQLQQLARALDYLTSYSTAAEQPCAVRVVAAGPRDAVAFAHAHAPFAVFIMPLELRGSLRDWCTSIGQVRAA